MKTAITLAHVEAAQSAYDSADKAVYDAIQATKDAAHRFAGRFFDRTDEERAAYEKAREAESAARDSRDEAQAALYAIKREFGRQVRAIVAGAILDHRADLEGKPTHHKRTQKAVCAIANEALAGSGVTADMAGSGNGVFFHVEGHPYDLRPEMLDLRSSFDHSPSIDFERLGTWYALPESKFVTARAILRQARALAKTREKVSKLHCEYVEKVKKAYQCANLLDTRSLLDPFATVEPFQVY